MTKEEEEFLFSLGFEKDVLINDTETHYYQRGKAPEGENRPILIVRNQLGKITYNVIHDNRPTYCTGNEFKNSQPAINDLLKKYALILKDGYDIKIWRYYHNKKLQHRAQIIREVDVNLDSEAISLVEGLFYGDVPEDVVHDKILELEG